MATSKVSVIDAVKRDRVGTRYARRVREQGGVPASVYGHGEKPESITIDRKTTWNRIQGGERVFTLRLGQAAEQTVLLKDIQFDYLGTNLIHVDFARVDLNETVEVHVHVNLKGDCIGLKTAGAILLHPTSEITVSCRVTDIVDHIDVDISALEVGKTVQAGDVPLPTGMTLASDPHDVLATIQVKAEVEAVGEQAAVEGEGAEPEVITERKAGEGEGAAAGGKEAKGGKEGKKE